MQKVNIKSFIFYFLILYSTTNIKHLQLSNAVLSYDAHISIHDTYVSNGIECMCLT